MKKWLWLQNVTVNVFESWRKIFNTMLSYMQRFTIIWNLISLRITKPGRFEKTLHFDSSHPIKKPVSHAPPHQTLLVFLNLNGSIKQNNGKNSKLFWNRNKKLTFTTYDHTGSTIIHGSGSLVKASEMLDFKGFAH